MKKRFIWNTYRGLLYFFLVIGMLSSLVLFHELYHLITIEGNPAGICLGKCYIGDELGQFAPAGISWNLTENQNTQFIETHKSNEQSAWIFSIVINAILIISLLYFQNEANK